MEQEITQLPTGNVTTVTETNVMSQKDAVYEAIHTLPKEYNVAELFQNSSEGKRLRKLVRERVYTFFKEQRVKLATEKTESELKKYCSGLVNHWLKKDSRYSN